MIIFHNQIFLSEYSVGKDCTKIAQRLHKGKKMRKKYDVDMLCLQKNV
jgi:hypothetical protein